MNKSNLIKLFSFAVVALTAFQGMIPDLPVGNDHSQMIVSAITMFLVSTLTIWKQAISKEIDNEAMLPVIAVAVAATMGGVNQLLDVFPLSAAAGQWIRFGVTMVTMIMNITSKIFYPTPETQSKL